MGRLPARLLPRVLRRSLVPACLLGAADLGLVASPSFPCAVLLQETASAAGHEGEPMLQCFF